jgi:hypothetical protein
MISSPVCGNNRWHRLVRQSGHVSPIPISISVILDVIALAKKRKVHTNTDRDDGNQKVGSGQEKSYFGGGVSLWSAKGRPTNTCQHLILVKLRAMCQRSPLE